MKHRRFSKKSFIPYNFWSSWDTGKLKASFYFSRQDESKYVSGDIEKSFLGLTSGHNFWFWHIMFKFRNPSKIRRIKIEKVFSHSLCICYKNPAGTPCKSEKCFSAPPPPPLLYNMWLHMCCDLWYLHISFCNKFTSFVLIRVAWVWKILIKNI